MSFYYVNEGPVDGPIVANALLCLDYGTPADPEPPDYRAAAVAILGGAIIGYGLVTLAILALT